MNTLESDTIKLCKYEILAEISFHSKTSKKQAVKVLCSRLLARHRLRYIFSKKLNVMINIYYKNISIYRV